MNRLAVQPVKGLHPLCNQLRWYLGLGNLLMVILLGNPIASQACEVTRSGPEKPQVFELHLTGLCTEEERANFAIPSHEIFRALQEGQHVDLLGVRVTGDLMLDQLPVISLDSVSESSPAIQRIISQRNISSGRVVQGSITIRDAEVQGSWATNLRNEVIFFLGAINITGTTFQQSIDFSQAVFVKTVNFSHSVISYEGFFIRTHFEERAFFDDVNFGTHSRFHKARFRQEVSFLGSQFHGVAEFLEVFFEERATFRNGQFDMGTGFSGAQFSGPADFQSALFSREVYFRFTNFTHSADFRETTFREVGDFMNAQFSEERDFSNADFHVPPQTSGTVLERELRQDNKYDELREKASLGLAFLGMLCILLWGFKRWRDSSHKLS